MMNNFFRYVAQLEESGVSFAICSVIESTEHAPGRETFKLCFTSTGESYGSVGGGALEYTSQQEALKMLKKSDSIKILDLNLQPKDRDGIGMECGGRVKVLIECFYPSPRLYIAGGGHIASYLVNFASALNFEVIVIDDREDYASSVRHPHAIEHRHLSYDVAFEPPHLFTPHAYYVIVTHQHSGDERVLRSILKRHSELMPNYIGLIGSPVKLSQLFMRMREDSFDLELLKSVYAPIGLDHGGQTASEIALAIAAEMTAIRHGRDLKDSMKNKRSPLRDISEQSEN